jgi:hypothetical protein
MNQKQVLRRYMKEFLIAMSMYVLILIVSITLLNNFEFSRAWQIVISIAPALPVIFVIAAILRALRNSDELIQRIQLQAVVLSAITTGLITFTYGFLENIGFPHFPTIWILPIMFALWGLSLAYFNRRYQ